MYKSPGLVYVFRSHQTTAASNMRVWGTLSCVALLWMLDCCLFEFCSAQNQNVSTTVLCRIFAVNDHALAICSTDTFTDLSTNMSDNGDPCWIASGHVMCDRLEFLSLASCLSERSAGIIEKVILSIPSRFTSVELLIFQTEDDDSQCGIEIPQNFGNLSSLEVVSIVLNINRINFYGAINIKKNCLATTIIFYDPMDLKRIMFFKWTGDPIFRVSEGECKYPDVFIRPHNQTLYSIMIPLSQTFYWFCTRQKVQPEPALIDVTIIATVVCSFILVVVTVTAVICFYRIRCLIMRRAIQLESISGIEAFRRKSQLMAIYAYGDRTFDDQRLLTAAADISYRTIGTAGSWQEILDDFKTKPQRVCIALITSSYLQEMRSFAENDDNDVILDQVTSFHLSQRTIPVLIGDINRGDFPPVMQTVYFKLNLQRWPHYPCDNTSIQNMIRQINIR